MSFFGLHMDALTEVGKITYRPAAIMASVNDMKITVKGKPAHGSSPWFGIDPIVVSAQIITSLQTIASRNVALTDNAAVVTIGAINGGNRSNIIPEQVEMLGTIRTFTDEDEAFVLKRIREIEKQFPIRKFEHNLEMEIEELKLEQEDL